MDPRSQYLLVAKVKRLAHADAIGLEPVLFSGLARFLNHVPITQNTHGEVNIAVRRDGNPEAIEVVGCSITVAYVVDSKLLINGNGLVRRTTGKTVGVSVLDPKILLRDTDRRFVGTVYFIRKISAQRASIPSIPSSAITSHQGGGEQKSGEEAKCNSKMAHWIAN